MEAEGEEEISNSSAVLLKVANLYASHLMSDISLVVGDIKWVIFWIFVKYKFKERQLLSQSF